MGLIRAHEAHGAHGAHGVLWGPMGPMGPAPPAGRGGGRLGTAAAGQRRAHNIGKCHHIEEFKLPKIEYLVVGRVPNNL